MPSTRPVIYPIDYNKNNPDYNSWAQYIHEENARIDMSETQKLQAELKLMDSALKQANRILNLKGIK